MSRQVFHSASSTLVPTRPVELIEINVRQRMNIFNTPNVNVRLNGFQIATPEILERTRNGAEAFRISAFSWDPLTHIMTMKPGDCGAAVMIDISAQNRKIELIKLGFDFSFNPVCFVAASSGVTQKLHHEDPNAIINNGIKAQQTLWLADEIIQFQSILQRSPFHTMAWSEVQCGGLATKLKQGPGLWVLKGHRIHGLDVRLGESGDLRIVKGCFEGNVVWDVYLDMGAPKRG